MHARTRMRERVYTRARINRIFLSLSLARSAILFSSAVAFMNDFSLFSHRCLDPQLIIRDLPSAQRDWPLATSWTVMANSRLRNHAGTPRPCQNISCVNLYARYVRVVSNGGDCFSSVSTVSFPPSRYYYEILSNRQLFPYFFQVS